MSQKLLDAEGKHIVAVVGAGHVPGMLREIRKVNDLAELEKIPEKKKSVIKWIIPGMVIALLAVGFSVGGTDKSLEMLYTWVLETALFAAIGAALAFAHPISILAGAVTAPLKCLHPLIAPGWFAGLSEAYLRRPRVEDLEKIGDDIVNISGWWKNRVTRILLVFALTNIGAKVGWVVGITSILKNLF
jgi:pheromone shutdown-related protein TraB